MSHFTTVELEIKDPDAIRGACESLGLELEEDSDARGYSSNTTHGDFVIRLPGPYDVALVKNAGTGLYDVQCDLYQGHVERALGSGFGRFMQAYGVSKTMIEAKKKGYVARQVKQEDGSIQIRIQV